MAKQQINQVELWLADWNLFVLLLAPSPPYTQVFHMERSADSLLNLHCDQHLFFAG
jgi:hypothetical protein